MKTNPTRYRSAVGEVCSKWEGGYFWNSGLWNPAYDIRNVSDLGFYLRYLDKQKYSTTRQTSLISY